MAQDLTNKKFIIRGFTAGLPGDHHRSGILVFPPLTAGIKNIELKILDIYGIVERKFYWELK